MSTWPFLPVLGVLAVGSTAHPTSLPSRYRVVNVRHYRSYCTWHQIVVLAHLLRASNWSPSSTSGNIFSRPQTDSPYEEGFSGLYVYPARICCRLVQRGPDVLCHMLHANFVSIVAGPLLAPAMLREVVWNGTSKYCSNFVF